MRSRAAAAMSVGRANASVTMHDIMRLLIQCFVTSILAGVACAAATPRESVNSIGVTLVRIEPGAFDMGVDSVPLPDELTKGLRGVSWDRPDGNGDYDESP